MHRKLNILFYVGGYSIFGSEGKMLMIMKGLKARGHHIHCITNGWSDGSFAALLNQNKIENSSSKLGFIYVTKPLWTFDTIINLPGAMLHHNEVIREFNPDVIYHNNYRSLMMLFFLLNRRRNIYHVGDVERQNIKNQLIFRSIGNIIQKIIASSEYIKKNLIDLGVCENKIEVVLNGSEALPIIESSKCDKVRVGIVGQILRRKGHIDFINALNLLKEKDLLKLLEVKIFGNGDNGLVAELKHEIETRQLENISFMGYEKDKSKIYNNLDIVVVPSHYEAFGFSALEPAFYSIPVIASRTGGLQEIVQDGETGLLFEARNERKLKEALEKLILNKDLREILGNNARKHALERFSATKMVDEIEQKIFSVVKV